MRSATVSQMKTGKNGPRNVLPREGTYTREVYDLLQANKGLPVEYMQTGTDRAVLIRLCDFYGLDIRIVKQGNSKVSRKSTYVLAGEWFGRVYIDYIAEHIDQPQRAS